jgi:CheY-like chemotaxis protein
MKMRILVVDDDAGNRRLASRMLGRSPAYTVEEADSGEACLRSVEQNHYDCILLDISMPKMDGIETCARLRAMHNGADSRVIACTAHASEKERDDFLLNGFDRVITKPFLIEELFESIEGDTKSCM